VLDGGEVARIFAWMRPNDLIWNYWVNNYLLGKTPPAFDMPTTPACPPPCTATCWTYKPCPTPTAWRCAARPSTSKQVDLDSFTVAGSNDHITPWDAVYRSALLLGGERRFVLSNSGHIQSILNPPGNPKATTGKPQAVRRPAPWFYDAERRDGAGGRNGGWSGWCGQRKRSA
jgi:polyhydroxyalkanoate synthase